MSNVDATQVAVLCYEVPDGSTTDVIKGMESIIDAALAEARLEGAKAMQEAAVKECECMGGLDTTVYLPSAV